MQSAQTRCNAVEIGTCSFILLKVPSVIAGELQITPSWVSVSLLMVHSDSVSYVCIGELGKMVCPKVDSGFVHAKNPTSVKVWKTCACSGN